MTTTNKSKVKVDKIQALQAQVSLGMAYLQKGDRDRALRAFNRALSLDKKSAESYQGLAMIHQLNGELEQAEKSFEIALKQRSDFSKAGIQSSYARLLFEQKRYQKAMDLLQKASEDQTFTSRDSALYYLGLCALNLGDATRAQGAFKHSLNLNQNNPEAAIELAVMSFEQKDYPSAKKYLDIHMRQARQSARSLLLGIKLERIFGNRDNEASYAMALKNLHPYSNEYLEYKKIESK